VQTLVTGCAGFIGSHLAEALLDAGHEVVGVDAFTDYYDPDDKRRNVRALVERPGFSLEEADLRRAPIEPLLDGVDVVFHLSGQPGVRISWAHGFGAYVEHNVLVTQRLLEAARAAPVGRIVYASSSSVYGNAPRYPSVETDLPRPHSPYGVTKLAAEHLCVLYAANWDLPTVSLRYFSVYGPRQRPDMGFRRFLEAAFDGAPLPVYGSGEQVRDFTYVGDIVRATALASEADLAPGTVMNAAGGESVTVNELVGVLGDLLDHELEIVHVPAQPGDVERTGGSNERARRLLRWEPRTPLREGLARQIEWTRALTAAVGSGLAAGAGSR
jgi:nucleoside-diphosphate-sugar epimerase